MKFPRMFLNQKKKPKKPKDEDSESEKKPKDKTPSKPKSNYGDINELSKNVTESEKNKHLWMILVQKKSQKIKLLQIQNNPIMEI